MLYKFKETLQCADPPTIGTGQAVLMSYKRPPIGGRDDDSSNATGQQKIPIR